MNVQERRYEGVATVAAVTNDDGMAVAVCLDPIDAAVFCRCLGYDAPLEHIEMLPVVEFAKRRDAR